MDLNNFRDRAYKNAVVHGWHEENLSNEHYLCLVMSELMEAVEADRKGMYANRKQFDNYMSVRKRSDDEFIYAFKYDIKDSFEDELADACIRLFDLAGLRGERITYIDSFCVPQLKASFTEYIYALCSFITNPDKSDKAWWLLQHINYCLGWIFSWCKDKNIDIMWYIEQKMKYNELRPYKHGNKKY